MPQPIDQSSPEDGFDSETIPFPGVSPATAETILKRLGGGVAEKNRAVEGVGFRAYIEEEDSGVSVTFVAHDELLDDLIRRFEDMAAKER